MSKFVWSAGDTDVMGWLRKQEVCCAVMVICFALLCMIAAGWLIYLATQRWPALGVWCAPMGWSGFVYGVGVAIGKLILWR